MAYRVKGVPWVYKGSVNVEDCKSSIDVMKKAGLDWTVEKCRLFAEMPDFIETHYDENSIHHGGNIYSECPNAFATYRTDYNIPLGVVKDRYTPVQNIDAFNFFDDAIGKNKAIWQTAGFFGRGERIFVSAKLPNNILVHGDPVENYLVFTTSHDGSSGVKILFTPIRVVCENTLNAAIRNTSNYVSFRHTKSVHENLDVAAEILGICEEKIYYLNEKYNHMFKIKMSDKEAAETFANVVLTEKEQQELTNTGHNVIQLINRDWRAIEDSRISMKKVNTLSEMNNYYYTGIGQREVLGTAWGVMNAVSGYYSNIQNNEGTKRMDSLLFGNSANNIKTANDLILEHKAS